MNVSLPFDELIVPLDSFVQWLLEYVPTTYEASSEVLDINKGVGNDRFLFPFEEPGKWYLYDASIEMLIFGGVLILLSVLTCINQGCFRGSQCLTRKNEGTLWSRNSKLIAMGLMVLCCLTTMLALLSSMVYAARLSEDTFDDVEKSYKYTQDLVDDAGRTVDNTQVLIQQVMAINTDSIEACVTTYNLNIDAEPALEEAILQSDLIGETVERLENVYNGMEGYGSGAMLALQWTIRIAVLAFTPIWILMLLMATIFMVRSTLRKVSSVSEAREVRQNRSCAERWCSLATMDAVFFINGLIAAFVFLFVVLSSDYCVDPDTRLMNALSVQRDFNVTLVPDVQEGTCTPFLIYDEGETGAQLPQIPSFYSNGLRDLCHVITCDPDVQVNAPIPALTEFESQVDGLREEFTTAIVDLENGELGSSNDTNSRKSCIEVITDAEEKLENTRSLRTAARLISCRTLNEIYAKTAYDNFCDDVPIDLLKLFMCMFIPVVFIFFANFLTEIFLLDEPTVEPGSVDKKIVLGESTLAHDDDHPEEVLKVVTTPRSVASDSLPPSPAMRNNLTSGGYMGASNAPDSPSDDFALEDITVAPAVVAVAPAAVPVSPAAVAVAAVQISEAAEDESVPYTEDPSVVDVVNVEIGGKAATAAEISGLAAAGDGGDAGEEYDSDDTIVNDDDDHANEDDHAFVAKMPMD